MRLLVVFGTIIFFSHFFLDGGDFVLAGSVSEEVVHLEEGLSECGLVVSLLVIAIDLKFFLEMSLDKGGNFGALMRVWLPPCPSNTPKM